MLGRPLPNCFFKVSHTDLPNYNNMYRMKIETLEKEKGDV